jgi:hypothetical protein
MPGFNEKCCTMPQFKGLSGGPKKLPNVPMQDDISGQSNQPALTPSKQSMTGYKSKATMGSKQHQG